MKDVKRWLQINLFVAVLISSTLLGIAMESTRMIAVGVIGATLGFIVTDLIRLFHLRGLIANIASIIILVLAMKDFFTLDGTGKLVSVANLLVYLQTVLMFQEKTPRLNWQVMVLTLLQVVVSAIFSLDLEGGMLLLTYFIVIGSAMFLQSIYTQQFEIDFGNRDSSQRVTDNLQDGATSELPLSSGGPVTFFDYGTQTPLKVSSIAVQLILWAAVSFAFTMVLFYLAPRHAPPWYGPLSTQVTTAGVSKSVDLDERGIIELSGQLMFRVRFRREDGGDLRLLGTPYFRGLALSDLVIKDGKTDWRAPQDRVSDEHYQAIPSTQGIGGEEGMLVYQSFKMEETEDPLVYGVFPFYRFDGTPAKMQFCHEISGLTRCRLFESIDLAPYKYQAATLVDSSGRFAKAWPYVSNTGPYVQRAMTEDEPQIKWLTRIDPTRYETLCQLSDQLAQDNETNGGNQLELMRRMESYLQTGGRFKYTLDFRNVQRDETLDPIEDFVRNHRSGHCELYASALTLMLRRQNIPARLVVGFRGGSYNQETNSYVVRANNAHAWVEAYVPREECTDEMVRSGQAGDGGAWMILEATPLANAENTDEEDFSELARNVWDDYVLGRDNESDESAQYSSSMFAWLRYLDMDYIDSRMQDAANTMNQPWIKYGVPGFILAFMAFLIIRKNMKDEEDSAGSSKAGFLRRVVASAISLISPELSKWVMGQSDAVQIVFYQKMVKLLAQFQLTRAPNQTHREFAKSAAQRFSSHDRSQMIGETIWSITEAFNEVRFGRVEIDPTRQQQLAEGLKQLESVLISPESA